MKLLLLTFGRLLHRVVEGCPMDLLLLRLQQVILSGHYLGDVTPLFQLVNVVVLMLLLLGVL